MNELEEFIQENIRMNLPKRFWDAKWDIMTLKNQEIVKRYVTEAFAAKDGKGLLLYGNEGSGKTYMSAVIAKILRTKGYLIYFLSAEDITYNGLKQDFDENNTILERCHNVDLLIIDDIKPMMDRNLYSILKYRMENMLSTILTLRVRMLDLPIDDSGGRKKYSFTKYFQSYFGDIAPVVQGCILPIPIKEINYREKEQSDYARMMSLGKSAV